MIREKKKSVSGIKVYFPGFSLERKSADMTDGEILRSSVPDRLSEKKAFPCGFAC